MDSVRRNVEPQILDCRSYAFPARGQQAKKKLP